MDLDSNSVSVSLRTLPDLDSDGGLNRPTTTAPGDAGGIIEHPEILVSLVFVEKLGSNECLKVVDSISIGRIHNNVTLRC